MAEPSLCVAPTVNAAVNIDGVELTEACAVGSNVAPSALGTSNFFADTSADTNGAVMRGFRSADSNRASTKTFMTSAGGEYFLSLRR